MPQFDGGDPETQALVQRFHNLADTARDSVYCLDPAKDPSHVRGLGPLAGHIGVDPYYFPEELVSERDRKASARAEAAMSALTGSKDTAGRSGLFHTKVEEMLRRNTQQEGEGAGPGDSRRHAEDEDALPPEELDEDDEEDMDNDYYNLAGQFDDDEEYGEYEDGGGDEGPIF